MAAGQEGLMWALIIITISLRFRPKRIENIIEFNHKASDLGYYTSFDIRYIQKCDFTIKTLFPVQNKENDIMAGRRQRHQIATRNSNNNILIGATLLILISGDIAENPGPIKFPCGSCAKPVKKNQKGIQCEDCLFWHHIECINLPVTDYITLSESSDSWYCSRCILPEFTDSFFEKSLRGYHTLQGDNSLKSVERFDHMMFVCKFQASRWSKPQREKLLCGWWIYSSESVGWNLLKFWYLLQWIYSNILPKK